MTNITGIILAGGKNSRIGTKKAFLEINGKPIIENILFAYKKIFNEIIIVTNTPEDYEYLGVKLVKDVFPDKGALGGLYTGLLEASNKYCFVSACDMPFINEDLIRHISGIEDYDIVIPVVNEKYEPLFALYSKNIISIIQRQLDNGDIKIIDFFPEVNLKKILISEIKKYDNKLRSFININTLEDYDIVLKKCLSERQNK